METQYKIIGGDGREYGPASLEELQSWIRDGRVSGSTSVWCSDSATWAGAATFAELLGELATQAPAVPAVEVARAAVGFWARLAAYFIDAILWSFIFYFVWDLIVAKMGWKIPVRPQPAPGMDFLAYLQVLADYFQKMMPLLMPQFLVGKAVQAIYEISFNGKLGATPGKMLIGAKIVRLDGTPIGYWLALLRWLAARVSDLAFCIGYLFIAFRPDKRALHDLMVGTKVVYKQ